MKRVVLFKRVIPLNNYFDGGIRNEFKDNEN
jgi:hypothetical protein